MASEPEESATEIPDLWEDREASKHLNAIFANRIFVQAVGDGLVRLNFGEITEEEPRYHSALLVSAHSAASFAQLMYQMASAILPPVPDLAAGATEQQSVDPNG